MSDQLEFEAKIKELLERGALIHHEDCMCDQCIFIQSLYEMKAENIALRTALERRSK